MKPSNPDLFGPCVRDDRIHPNFRALRDSQIHREARAFMNALYLRMGDPNGNYVRDFQGSGFHARLFELACFAYLDSAGFTLDRTHERPDFLAHREGVTIALEAATANPPAGSNPDISITRMEPYSQETLEKKVLEEAPQRILAVLRNKLKHRYHELPHCVGLPLVLVVAPYFEPGSVFYTDEAMVPCLYPYSPTVEPRFKYTPLFSMHGSEAIAAVLFCNQFTVPRFWRLAPRKNGIFPLQAMREGMYWEDFNATDFAIGEYRYKLDDPSVPVETWSQGVTIFHNPDAAVPLPPGILPCTSAFRVGDDGLHREVYGFHPVTSFLHLLGNLPMKNKSLNHVERTGDR